MNDRKYILIWLVINVFLTIIVTALQISGTFWLEILLLIVYVLIFLKIRLQNMLAPIAILFTIRTFMEGFTAVLTAYASKHWKLSFDSIVIQMLISLFFDIIFLLMIQWIQRKFLFSLQKSISSYLYVLLLPCALIVLAIRYGLRLDHVILEEYLSSFHLEVSLTVLFLMISAVIIFFIMLEIFCKVVQIVDQETEITLLTSQVAGQQIYLEEAKERNEQYAAFQHDIKNHLLVLSGLMKCGKYKAAEQYANKLQTSCRFITFSVFTGNLILDTLLKEKLSYAKGNKIQVDCSVQIPAQFYVDDMDLCIIFSNILDNAITACMQMEEPKRILRISTKTRANFLVIESINSVAISKPIEMGIGLRNIENIAKKYQGITEIKNVNETFQIRVLLCSLKK